MATGSRPSQNILPCVTASLRAPKIGKFISNNVSVWLKHVQYMGLSWIVWNYGMCHMPQKFDGWENTNPNAMNMWAWMLGSKHVVMLVWHWGSGDIHLKTWGQWLKNTLCFSEVSRAKQHGLRQPRICIEGNHINQHADSKQAGDMNQTSGYLVAGRAPEQVNWDHLHCVVPTDRNLVSSAWGFHPNNELPLLGG